MKEHWSEFEVLKISYARLCELERFGNIERIENQIRFLRSAIDEFWINYEDQIDSDSDLKRKLLEIDGRTIAHEQLLEKERARNGKL